MSSDTSSVPKYAFRDSCLTRTTTGRPGSDFGCVFCRKSTGQLHSAKGAILETVGNLTGNQNLKQSGREEHAAGQREVEAAKAKNVAEGVTDRAVGKKDAVVGGLTGDRSQEIAGELLSLLFPLLFDMADRRAFARWFVGNVRHDKGEVQQKANNDVL